MQTASQSSTTWIIAPIVSATIVIGLVAVFVVRHILKLRQRRRQQTQTTNEPCGLLVGSRRNKKPSHVEKLGEEEEQRSMIIRKSLAERSSRSSAHSRRHESISSLTSMLEPSINERSGDGSESDGEGDLPVSNNKRVSGGLRDDWKEFEARVQRERSYSGEIHPAAHPATARPTPYQDLRLPQRTVTRSRSSSQSSLPTQELPSLVPHTAAGARLVVSEQPREGTGTGGDWTARPKPQVPDITVYRAE